MQNEIEFNGNMYPLPNRDDNLLDFDIKDAITFFTLNYVKQQFSEDIFDITINGCTYAVIPNIEYDDDCFEYLSLSIIVPDRDD
jgi:hypothetical protein